MSRAGALLALVVLASCRGENARGWAPPYPYEPPQEYYDSLASQPILAACRTPAVDGALSAGEWEGAIPVRFALALPDCGGSAAEIPAELLAGHDDQNLYLALRVGADLSAYGIQVDASLDGTGSEIDVDGDDWLSFTWAPGAGDGPAQLEDGFLWACYPGPGAPPGLCRSLDVRAWEAFLPPGTSDGGGAVHRGEAETTLELWHPYHGGDAHDVQVWSPQLLGLRLRFDLSRQCGAGSDGASRIHASAAYPAAPRNHTVRMDECSAAPLAPMVEVRIGGSGDPLPLVYFDNRGTTTATVMGSASFDVTSVDPATLFLAGAPARDPAHARPQDVNGDGFDDLVATFGVLDMPQPTDGDTELTLAGRTRDGRGFYGLGGARGIHDR